MDKEAIKQLWMLSQMLDTDHIERSIRNLAEGWQTGSGRLLAELEIEATQWLYRQLILHGQEPTPRITYIVDLIQDKLKDHKPMSIRLKKDRPPHKSGSN